jgi:type I restriction enzyme S subunit
MGEWKKTRLGNVISTNAISYSTKEKWMFVNYLDTGNITENVISEIQKIDLNTEKLPSRAKRKVQYNSILYSTVRPNQRHYGIIKAQPEHFLVSTGFTVIDVDASRVDADFLYFLLSQDEFVELLHSIAEQSVSAYPSIKPSDIENLEVNLPPLDEQKQIASILGTLSDKMSQNTEINKNLAS